MHLKSGLYFEILELGSYNQVMNTIMSFVGQYEFGQSNLRACCFPKKCSDKNSTQINFITGDQLIHINGV